MNWSEAVRLAREGKEEGFNFLYEQTYQKSYYTALKYMKQEEAAADVVQEAYIKAFSSLEQLQDAEKFTGWLSRIVATKALDELRKKKMVLFSQLQTDDEEISMEELLADERIDNQPELALDQEETSRLVQEMIDTLSDEQRMCVIMFYIENLSVRNIAQMLGISENTVKSRLKYGRKNIEEKVLELEKKGTKLYGIAPFPFFLYLLLKDSMSAQAAQIPLSTMLKAKTIPVKAGKGIATKATAITIRKSIIGIVAGLVVCGGAAAMIHFMTDSNADVQETVNELQISEEQEVQQEAAEVSQTKTSEEEKQETAESESTEVIEDVFVEEFQTEEAIAEEQEVPAYTYTDLSKTMFAQQSVNIRDLPSTDGNKLGALALNQEVTVTGQCNETSWYRIDYNGSTAYVSNKYIVAEKVEATQQDKPTIQQTVSKGNWADGYELHTWYDMGEYFFYIGTDVDDAIINGLNPQSIFVSIGQYDPNTYGGILQARYPDRMITSCGTGSIPDKSGVMFCAVNQKSNGYPDWDSVDWLWDSWD